MTQLAFGEWLPDLPEHANPGAILARNCLPQLKSYRSMRSLEAFTTALTTACLGSVWARANNNDIYNFAGDTAALYRLSGATWNDVSKALGYVAANWEFAQFGERVIATDIADTPQYFDLGTSAAFDDLPGSPPNAAHIGIVRDFVVLGDVDDGTRRPRRVQWGGFNNSEQWVPSASTQAGRQDLKGRGGPIRRVVEGDVGTIFQERSITRMTYVGPPIKFRFDEVERARGAAASGGVLWTGAKAFYYATDGFYMLDLYGGTDSQPIGANRVDRWFRLNAAPEEIVNMRGAIDSANSLVMWAFKSSSSSTTNDRLLIYNWKADRWAYAEIEIQHFAEFATQGLTLDDLDSILADIDSESIAVDSTAFSGGSIGLLAFDSSNQGATFSGPNLNVALDTKEFGQDGALSFINGVRPLIEGSGNGFTITPITRDLLTENPTEGLPATMNEIGICEVRANARYHRFRLRGTDDFSHASGVEFDAMRRGKR